MLEVAEALDQHKLWVESNGKEGIRGTVASTGFGNGTANPPPGGGKKGTVAASGFGNASDAAAEAPKKKAAGGGPADVLTRRPDQQRRRRHAGTTCRRVERAISGGLGDAQGAFAQGSAVRLPEGLDDRSAVQRGNLALGAPVHEGGEVLPALHRLLPVLDHASR